MNNPCLNSFDFALHSEISVFVGHGKRNAFRASRVLHDSFNSVLSAAYDFMVSGNFVAAFERLYLELVGSRGIVIRFVGGDVSLYGEIVGGAFFQTFYGEGILLGLSGGYILFLCGVITVYGIAGDARLRVPFQCDAVFGSCRFDAADLLGTGGNNGLRGKCAVNRLFAGLFIGSDGKAVSCCGLKLFHGCLCAGDVRNGYIFFLRRVVTADIVSRSARNLFPAQGNRRYARESLESRNLGKLLCRSRRSRDGDCRRNARHNGNGKRGQN